MAASTQREGLSTREAHTQMFAQHIQKASPGGSTSPSRYKVTCSAGAGAKVSDPNEIHSTYIRSRRLILLEKFITNWYLPVLLSFLYQHIQYHFQNYTLPGQFHYITQKFTCDKCWVHITQFLSEQINTHSVLFMAYIGFHLKERKLRFLCFDKACHLFPVVSHHSLAPKIYEKRKEMHTKTIKQALWGC